MQRMTVYFLKKIYKSNFFVNAHDVDFRDAETGNFRNQEVGRNQCSHEDKPPQCLTVCMFQCIVHIQVARGLLGITVTTSDEVLVVVIF